MSKEANSTCCGNPESADATIARASDIFIADKLSDLNKTQLDSLGVHWVELRSENGYQKFGAILKQLDVPAEDFTGDLAPALTIIFNSLFH